MEDYIRKDKDVMLVAQFTSQHMLPDNEEDDQGTEEYPEGQQTKGGIEQDN